MEERRNGRRDGPGPLPATLDPYPAIGLFAVRGDTLYFAGAEASTGLELWKLEGGVASLVKDIPARPGFLDHSHS